MAGQKGSNRDGQKQEGQQAVSVAPFQRCSQVIRDGFAQTLRHSDRSAWEFTCPGKSFTWDKCRSVKAQSLPQPGTLLEVAWLPFLLTWLLLQGGHFSGKAVLQMLPHAISCFSAVFLLPISQLMETTSWLTVLTLLSTTSRPTTWAFRGFSDAKN